VLVLVEVFVLSANFLFSTASSVVDVDVVATPCRGLLRDGELAEVERRRFEDAFGEATFAASAGLKANLAAREERAGDEGLGGMLEYNAMRRDDAVSCVYFFRVPSRQWGQPGCMWKAKAGETRPRRQAGADVSQ
jgi:hypothetical protein